MARFHHIMLASLLLLASLQSNVQALTTTNSVTSPSLGLFGNSYRKPKRAYRSVSHLAARRYYGNGDNERNHDDMERERSIDRPTKTMFDVMGPPFSPAKPKIVVLGATGKIGCMVVKQLLEMKSIDMTVVALVRDYDKAVQVLYDDLVVARSQKGGPKLQIVEGNLVPPEELPGFSAEDSEDEQVLMDTAQSTSSFYDSKIEEYDNRELLPDINEALEDAIKDCTTVISCVGSLRPTNVWTDFLERPFWRLLRSDVSNWCQDPRHPFYTHYASTRKALGYAEREQLKREATATTLAEADEDLDADTIRIPKIRFIRISDLCVGHKPWHFVPLVTNVIQSVVFRYQEMAEQLLDHSTLLETVVLRPGDLVDDDRDDTTTSLQVCQSGTVPSPARVGREDVASLAVAAAMFPTKNDTTVDNAPFHYTLACRWAGQELDPFPPQGRKADGQDDAETALKRALNTIYKNEQRLTKQEEKRKQKKINQIMSSLMIRMTPEKQRRRIRPKAHGICASIPVYLFLSLFAKTLMYPLIRVIPGGKAWMLPALSRLNEMMVAIFSFWLAKLVMAVPWLTRRTQYISF